MVNSPDVGTFFFLVDVLYFYVKTKTKSTIWTGTLDETLSVKTSTRNTVDTVSELLKETVYALLHTLGL